MELTTAEENYLKAIYHLSEEGKKSVSTNDIAASIQTKPASVSDMLRKLGEKEVIQYRKYYGLQITPLGMRLALQTIRKHRLWEVFLVDKLGFAWDEVHEVAEQVGLVGHLVVRQQLQQKRHSALRPFRRLRIMRRRRPEAALQHVRVDDAGIQRHGCHPAWKFLSE